jgi:hypothetical protein
MRFTMKTRKVYVEEVLVIKELQKCRPHLVSKALKKIILPV